HRFLFFDKAKISTHFITCKLHLYQVFLYNYFILKNNEGTDRRTPGITYNFVMQLHQPHSKPSAGSSPFINVLI
ncbi:MAG: hypothetical protein ACM3VS_11410, partial [Candidatus Dadabacteria bacterium]